MPAQPAQSPPTSQVQELELPATPLRSPPFGGETCSGISDGTHMPLKFNLYNSIWTVRAAAKALNPSWCQIKLT
eukprot:m.336542 g.336542  ORF g.336542 m.336542 type:complete len:74 (-) comp27785_c1_seq12:34-255(-)